MKHKHSDVARMLFVCPYEEGAQRLSIWCGDEELLEIGDAEL
jgi:hypothetical protein